MRSVKLTIQFDGTDFAGYELQPGQRTIRNELAKALRKIYRQPVKFNSSSRTDAGVHAVGLVISYKPPFKIPLNKLPLALNAILPDDIRVQKAEEVGVKFNARYDAKNKTYEYLIFNGEIMPPQARRIAWQVRPALNLAAMKKAAKYLVGKHDFSSFCAAGGDDKDKVREIHSFVISHLSLVISGSEKIPVISLRVTGNGFLYKMVRNLAGTLVDVGLGRKGPDEVKFVLEAKDRKLAGRTAPAQGLCLVKVKY